MYYIYRIIASEWRKDEELCGAADTLENAELLVDAMNVLDEAHREIRTESGEVALLKKRKYYVYHVLTTETGIPAEENLVGIADTLENAREFLKEMSQPPEDEIEDDLPSEEQDIWKIKDEDGNIVE